MEALTVGIALGAGAMWLTRDGRPRVKAAIGWVARQTGWLAGRVRADVNAARKVARDEFEKARAENLAAPDVAFPVAAPLPARTDVNGHGMSHTAS